MRMTIRDAIDYVRKADGVKFTKELNDRITSFLHKLPRNPEEESSGEYDVVNNEVIQTSNQIIVKDYNEGWFAEIRYGKDEDGNMYVQVDGDNMDASTNRVKDNREAIQLVAELKAIKWASDIDKYWNMSDDHSYWRKMNDLDRKASSQREMILRKLR